MDNTSTQNVNVAGSSTRTEVLSDIASAEYNSAGYASTSTINEVTPTHPLKGIRILDMTRIVAGPYCTMVLGDLGADIIKVERPFHGDESRNWGPFMKDSGTSLYFLASNRNKQSICIDIKKGRDIIYQLSKKCDVLIENYKPGNLDEIKLGYQDFKNINPRLIYCSITGYGPTGPYAKKPGYDVIAASVGGLLNITGAENGPPAKVGIAVTDIATGLYAHGAILAALFQREKTGRGQKIDVNLLSTQISCLINIGSSYLNAGIEGRRWGTSHESIVPYEAFKTKSGYITIGAGSDLQFKSLCLLLQIPKVGNDPRFKSNRDRVEHRADLIKILSDILLTQTTQFWMKKMEDATFPVGPINKISEVFDDPHVKKIEIVKELKHKEAGSVKVVGPPVVYSEAMCNARTGPPTLGEHTNKVLKTILNYDDDFIDDLRKKRIIQ